MIAFIAEHREACGVEPICRVLPIAPSTYYAHATRRADPGKLPARARSDAAPMVEIRRVFEANFHVYGVRRVWRQLGRERIVVAYCTVARLMQAMGLNGAVRGRKVRTTIPDPAAACPLDRVNRQFKARRPNALWVSDITYVATWADFVYVAFVIDAFARRIVGWWASRTAQAGLVLDALEQALPARHPVRGAGLVHHSDRGVQYILIDRDVALAALEALGGADATAAWGDLPVWLSRTPAERLASRPARSRSSMRAMLGRVASRTCCTSRLNHPWIACPGPKWTGSMRRPQPARAKWRIAFSTSRSATPSRLPQVRAGGSRGRTTCRS